MILRIYFRFLQKIIFIAEKLSYTFTASTIYSFNISSSSILDEGKSVSIRLPINVSLGFVVVGPSLGCGVVGGGLAALEHLYILFTFSMSFLEKYIKD